MYFKFKNLTYPNHYIPVNYSIQWVGQFPHPVNTEVYQLYTKWRRSHEEIKYNPCSHGNYNLAKNGDIAHMIKHYRMKQDIREGYNQDTQLDWGIKKVFPNKHESSDLTFNRFKGDSVCVWSRSCGGCWADECGKEVCSRRKITGECMHQEKNRIFEELKESHTWSIGNKEEAMRYKIGKKGRHGVSRQHVKIALPIKKRRQPLKSSKQGCFLIIFEF